MRTSSCAGLCVAQVLLSLGVVTIADADIRMRLQERPNVKERLCRSSKVKKRDTVRLHYNASIADSSPVGTPGLEVENTRKAPGDPVELIVGVGQTGWDQALVHLCVGDKANLLVYAPDAPYGIERFKDNVPGGAVVNIMLEIISSEPSDIKLRDHDSYLFSSADKNADNRLSQTEFLYYFKDKKTRIGSPQYRQVLKELGQLFTELDQNKDKFLTLNEFTFLKTSLHARTELRPRDEFDFYDDNHDGKLNKREVEGFFKAIKRRVPMDYWKHMDKNRNGYISFEEFTKKAFAKYSKDQL